MPATCAHPLIIIPIKKLFPSLSMIALAIGSMGPDLTYFIPFLDISRRYTHSFLGIFISSLPIALIAYYLYTYILRKPLYRSLPWQIEMPEEKSTFLKTSLALIIGITLHLVWDNFTHENDLFPIMSKHLFTAMGKDFKLFQLLQYCSSIVGTLWLGLLLLSNYKKMITPKTPFEIRRLIPLVIAFTGTGIFTVIILGSPQFVYKYVVAVLNISTPLFITLLCLSSKLIHQGNFSTVKPVVKADFN